MSADSACGCLPLKRLHHVTHGSSARSAQEYHCVAFGIEHLIMTLHPDLRALERPMADTNEAASVSDT
ncbi:hypothetical protein CERZMDRAFT_91626 [Cercospora zeae-maydis SCOH1-5]|uniref:Uncharacterized protein n=1 Tax=Cercospora zeae-maydis SCOH1-5 TaxID=717836 RepID=A0A6A6F766_9PEZI|nr:hypothetical protein CERZMDRAFT_91626 [Cercospora zeae-maydis SCOH1-5]